jgi:hypothetical protein
MRKSVVFPDPAYSFPGIQLKGGIHEEDLPSILFGDA